MNKKRIKYKLVISIIIPIIVVGYCLSQIELTHLATILIHSSWQWIFLGLIVFVLNQLLRTLRFSILIHSKNVNFNDLFKVQCLYSFFSYLLPFRSGELSYVYFLRKHMDIPTPEGVATLVIARVFDYITISFIFFFVLFLIWDKIPCQAKVLTFPVVIVLLIAFIFFFVLVFWGRKIIGLIKAIENKRMGGWNFIRVIRRKSEDVIDSFQKITLKKVYPKMFIISILVWFVLAFSFYLIIQGLGYQVNYLTALCLTVLLFPISFVQGVGNLGTHEAEWVPVLILFGFNQETAITIALNSHAIILAYILLMAGYGKLAMVEKPLWCRR